MKMVQVAEFVRERTPAVSRPCRSPFPTSLAVHCVQTQISPVSPSTLGYWPGASRLLVDTHDPQLDAHASLHSLALRAAGVLPPHGRMVAVRGLQNGAVCLRVAVKGEGGDAPEGEAGVAEGGEWDDEVRALIPSRENEPRSVQAELTARLIEVSRLRNAGSESDGVHWLYSWLHCGGRQLHTLPAAYPLVHAVDTQAAS
jgi:hypothetical protein